MRWAVWAATPSEVRRPAHPILVSPGPPPREEQRRADREPDPGAPGRAEQSAPFLPAALRTTPPAKRWREETVLTQRWLGIGVLLCLLGAACADLSRETPGAS